MRILQVYCRSTDAIHRKLIFIYVCTVVVAAAAAVRLCVCACIFFFVRRAHIICPFECENDTVECRKWWWRWKWKIKWNFKLTPHQFHISTDFFFSDGKKNSHNCSWIVVKRKEKTSSSLYIWLAVECDTIWFQLNFTGFHRMWV